MDLSSDVHFRMTRLADGRRLWVALEGELDTANAESVRGLAELRDHYDHVVFDLARLAFIDSSGLKALVALRNAGLLVTIRGASRSTWRLMDVMGLVEFLDVR